MDKGIIEQSDVALTLLRNLKEIRDEVDGHDERYGIFLLEDYYRRIGAFVNKAVYLPEAPRVKHALNPTLDYEALQTAYLDSTPELLFYDDFLTPEALQALIDYCLDSTFWFDVKSHGGYLGAYSDEGFDGELLFQIANELHQRFPLIFKDYQLTQMWAYKYDSSMSGIKVHADFAAVNVNFWITVDEANLDPESGGLVVYTVEAPGHWDFESYNTRADDIYKFLADNNAGEVVIPHRQNRMVMFNSNLFHKSDHHGRFRTDKYNYRRINVVSFCIIVNLSVCYYCSMDIQ